MEQKIILHSINYSMFVKKEHNLFIRLLCYLGVGTTLFSTKLQNKTNVIISEYITDEEKELLKCGILDKVITLDEFSYDYDYENTVFYIREFRREETTLYSDNQEVLYYVNGYESKDNDFKRILKHLLSKNTIILLDTNYNMNDVRDPDCYLAPSNLNRLSLNMTLKYLDIDEFRDDDFIKNAIFYLTESMKYYLYSRPNKTEFEKALYMLVKEN